MTTHAPALDSRQSWRILAAAGAMFVVSVPALFGTTFGMFMVPFEKAMGWGRADIAFSLTLTVAISWLSVLAAGWLADHMPLRPLMAVGIVLGAANLAAFSWMSQLWHFYVLVVALAFTTMGASPLILAKLVQGWFRQRLGTALGVLFACSSVGAVVHPQIVTAVMAQADWRAAFQVMALIHLVGSLLALWVVRERVADAAGAAGAAGVPTAALQAAAQEKAPMVAFLANRTWWMLAVWNLTFAFGSGAIMVHFAALLHDRGVTPAQIGIAASAIGASLFAGNLLAGWLVDRLNPRTMAWGLMLAPLASALLMLWGQGYAAMFVTALVLGLASGSDGALSAFLARHYFGEKLYGQASGTQMVATAVGGGTAPWLSGLLRDSSGDYALSLWMSVAAFALAVLAGWLLPARGFVAKAA
jgi:sugar phosphate permease